MLGMGPVGLVVGGGVVTARAGLTCLAAFRGGSLADGAGNTLTKVGSVTVSASGLVSPFGGVVTPGTNTHTDYLAIASGFVPPFSINMLCSVSSVVASGTILGVSNQFWGPQLAVGSLGSNASLSLNSQSTANVFGIGGLNIQPNSTHIFGVSYNLNGNWAAFLDGVQIGAGTAAGINFLGGGAYSHWIGNDRNNAGAAALTCSLIRNNSRILSSAEFAAVAAAAFRGKL